MRGVDLTGVPAASVNTVLQSPGFSFFPTVVETSSTVTVTADVTSHTKGAWTEIVAATSADATWVIVAVTGMAAASTDTRGLLDIGVGAAASETVAVANLPAGFSGTGTPLSAWVPVRVPKGTRISARLQSLVSADTASVTVTLLRGQRNGVTASTKVDTYGADTANSRGTNLPTNDTYVQITAATTQPYRALLMLPVGGAGTSYAAENSTYTLAIGAAAAEVALTTASVSTTTSESISLNTLTPGAIGLAVGNFPTGTRIACKQSVGRSYRDVIVLGIPYA